MRLWVLVHIAAAIAGMGPEVAFGMMTPRARRAGLATAAPVYDAVAVARARVVVPALVVQVVSGIALIILGKHRLSETWLSVSLILYAIAFVLVIAVLVPGSARARAAFAAGIAPDDPRLRGLWTRIAATGGTAATLLTAVVVLMVLKPSF